jgi:hypothetical protein
VLVLVKSSDIINRHPTYNGIFISCNLKAKAWLRIVISFSCLSPKL